MGKSHEFNQFVVQSEAAPVEQSQRAEVLRKKALAAFLKAAETGTLHKILAVVDAQKNKIDAHSLVDLQKELESKKLFERRTRAKMDGGTEESIGGSFDDDNSKAALVKRIAGNHIPRKKGSNALEGDCYDSSALRKRSYKRTANRVAELSSVMTAQRTLMP